MVGVSVCFGRSLKPSVQWGGSAGCGVATEGSAGASLKGGMGTEGEPTAPSTGEVGVRKGWDWGWVRGECWGQVGLDVWGRGGGALGAAQPGSEPTLALKKGGVGAYRAR